MSRDSIRASKGSTSLKISLEQMTISFIGGNRDTGVSGIASKSSFVKTNLNWLFKVHAISLGVVT